MSCFRLNQLCKPKSNVTNVSICSEFYLVSSLSDKGNIATWNLLCPSEEPATLVGHHRLVTAIALSNYPDQHYLCSCSSDNIILWNLLQNGGKPNRGKVLLSNVEKPSHCCFSQDNLTVAVCCSSDVILLGLIENARSILIEQGCLMSFCYFIWDNLLLTTDESSLLKTHDIETGDVLHQRRVSPGFLNIVCVDIKSNHIAVGTSCGNVYVYGKELNLIREIQIWRTLKHFMDKENYDDEIKIRFESDCSFPVQAIHLFSYNDPSKNDCYFPAVHYALVVTSSCLFIINLNTEDVVYFLDFNDCSLNFAGISTLGLTQSASISISNDKLTAFIALLPLISKSILLMEVRLKEALNKISDERVTFGSVGDHEYTSSGLDGDGTLTFLHSGRIECASSFLSCTLPSSMSNSSASKKLGNGKVHKKIPSPSTSFPVTNHDKIKSSGYGNVSRRVLFQPRINKTSTSGPQRFGLNYLKQALPRKPLKIDKLFATDTIFDPVKSEFLAELNFRDNPTLMSLHIEAEGNHATCTSTEGVIDVIKIAKNRIKLGNTINGHSSMVTSAKWSHSGKMIISSSADKTVKLWNLDNLKHEPVLTIGHDSKVDGNAAGLTTKNIFDFEGAVEWAQFYYLDKFILASSGNTLYLFDYLISTKKSDLKRYSNKSHYKLVVKIPTDSKRITAVAAANQFHSIVLCAGSSKSIDTFDMTTGTLVWHSEDVGTKPAHGITINEGSPNMNQAVSLYDLFMTATLFDGIKVWDIRTKRPVMCYKEHRCRSIPCEANFSSCGKYIATGSEDKAVYIYDLRMTSCLHKLCDHHSDVVAGVAFSPKKKQLLTSSLNGTLCLYGEKEIM